MNQPSPAQKSVPGEKAAARQHEHTIELHGSPQKIQAGHALLARSLGLGGVIEEISSQHRAHGEGEEL